MDKNFFLKKKNIFIFVLTIIILFVSFNPTSITKKIAILEIDGVIKNPKAYLASIDKIKNDSSIKGLIIRIDSPGGTVGSSQEIYNSLLDLSSKIPVVSSIVDIGASGGYLIACGSSYIFANSGSITGSIGVISQYYDFSELIKFLRFDIDIVKSGAMKDIGNPAKSLSSKEKKLLNILIQDVHNQFKSVVKERRKLNDKEINSVSDGRIFSGNQALNLKLIDEIGGLNAAKSYIEKEIGIADLDLEYFPKKEKKLLEKLLPFINASEFNSFFDKKFYFLYTPNF
ncbi:MAG: signal peptide peptidase SppA [Thermodesulfobacteriota bacteirum]|jgi:protease-4|nr:signal peptide peptidase SppA [Thermodesulfobacteriota bacterium]|tara:strand:+ start:11006 stop:11860 length:855 start_codon:yes stop_codon:yes gene_type:complete